MLSTDAIVFKQFLKDSVIYGIGGVLTRGISVLLVPLYTRLLPPTEYGMVDIVNIFGTIVGLTVALEIAQGIARYYPATHDPDARLAYSSTALWFTTGMYVLFTLSCSLSAPMLSSMLLNSPAHVEIIRIAVLSIAMSGIFRFALGQLRWALRPSVYSIVSIVAALAIIAAAGLFVLVLRMGVLGVFCAMLTGNLVGTVLALSVGRAMYRFRFDWHRCRELLHFSLPLVPSSVAVFVSLYIDRIAIKELLSLGDLGVFGVGYRVASVVGFLMLGCQAALTPLIYTNYEREDTPLQLARIFRYFVALSLLVCLGLAIFARDILAVFTTPAYYGAATVIPLLAPAVLLATMSIFAPGLSIAKRTASIAVISIVVAAVNTALNFSLIPVFGIRGAALSTLISASLGFVAYMVLSQHLYPVPHRWGHFVLATFSTIALGFAATSFSFGFWWDTIVRTVALLVLVFVLVQLRLISSTDMERGLERVRLVLGLARQAPKVEII